MLVAGMIAAFFQREVWFWTVIGPYLPDQLRPESGEADTLGEAEAAFRKKFDKWMEWANTLNHQVVWNVEAERQWDG